MLLRDAAAFPLAQALRADAGTPIADVFEFTSGLYFRGKLAYVRAFGDPPPGVSAALVITTDRGLVDPDTRVTPADLRRFATVPIATTSHVFTRALSSTARQLARRIDANTTVVLLGSIATGKYADPLLDVFGERLLFPATFIGRGDMSRGGLMLRAAESGEELVYTPLSTAPRHGARPPRLEPIRRR